MMFCILFSHLLSCDIHILQSVLDLVLFQFNNSLQSKTLFSYHARKIFGLYFKRQIKTTPRRLLSRNFKKHSRISVKDTPKLNYIWKINSWVALLIFWKIQKGILLRNQLKWIWKSSRQLFLRSILRWRIFQQLPRFVSPMIHHGEFDLSLYYKNYDGILTLNWWHFRLQHSKVPISLTVSTAWNTARKIQKALCGSGVKDVTGFVLSGLSSCPYILNAP